MKLASTDHSVLMHFAGAYLGRVMPDGASYLNGVRRQAANRLVKKGLLARVEGPMGAGYRLTETGKKMAGVKAIDPDEFALSPGGRE